MIDRGIIKWKPFDSCFSSQKIIKDVNLNKQKIELPILSEDQIKLIEEKIIDAYNLKIDVYVTYYSNGFIKEEKGKIYKINRQEKKIYLNQKIIFVKQILKVIY